MLSTGICVRIELNYRPSSLCYRELFGARKTGVYVMTRSVRSAVSVLAVREKRGETQEERLGLS